MQYILYFLKGTQTENLLAVRTCIGTGYTFHCSGHHRIDDIFRHNTGESIFFSLSLMVAAFDGTVYMEGSAWDEFLLLAYHWTTSRPSKPSRDVVASIVFTVRFRFTPCRISPVKTVL